MRLFLAIRVFFYILFGIPLPDEVSERLLGPGRAKAELPPRVGFDAEAAKREVAEAKREVEAANAREAEARAQAAAAAKKIDAVKVPEAAKPEVTKPEPTGPSPEAIAVRAISVFQAEGRLFDFLSEDIDGYQDAEVGAAVREIHRGCRRALKDHYQVTPVRSEDEESLITVPEGYDPSEIRLVGNVVGKPPFSGTLKHKGWKVEVVRLPNIPDGKGAKVIVPAEVEV